MRRRTEERLDRLELVDQTAADDEFPPLGEATLYPVGQWPQVSDEQVREHDVEPRPRTRVGGVQRSAGELNDARTHLVGGQVGRCDPQRFGIDVDRKDGAGAELGRSDRQHARAGADIEHCVPRLQKL